MAYLVRCVRLCALGMRQIIQISQSPISRQIFRRCVRTHTNAPRAQRFRSVEILYRVRAFHAIISNSLWHFESRERKKRTICRFNLSRWFRSFCCRRGESDFRLKNYSKWNRCCQLDGNWMNDGMMDVFVRHFRQICENCDRNFICQFCDRSTSEMAREFGIIICKSL